MRGTYGADFDVRTVYRVGRALPRVFGRLGGGVSAPRILVGRDCRVTSAAVRDALVAGLLEAGAEVTDLGLCTTPMVYFFTAADGYDGSAMITASHNPPSDNGIKVSMRTALPVGYASGLDEVERLVLADAAEYVGGTPPPVASVPDAAERYVEWQKSHGGALQPDALRFAVDCSCGMASLLVPALYPSATVLNGVMDGRFPAHSPNPLKEEARAQVAAAVREGGLDCGVVFDGDADRAMFVDETGRFVQPDMLIPAVAEESLRLAGGPGAAGERPRVLHDVRTSRGVSETLAEGGFEPVMVPVGHAFAKPKMREHRALCGGELAGHYYFGDFFGCDSGVLAASRILAAVAAAKQRGVTFSGMMKAVSSRYANSGEMNFRVEDKDAAIERVVAAAEKFGRQTGMSEMDGVRIEFEDGWVNVRKSNTEPYLRLIAENRSPDGLARWIGALEVAIGAR